MPSHRHSLLSRPLSEGFETHASERSGLALTAAGIVVYVHEGVPTDASFDAFLSFCRVHQDAIRGYLTYAEGGLPTPAQRARASADYDRFEPQRTAIITQEPGARPMARTFDWLRGGAWFAAFDPSDLEGARSFLGLSPADFEAALDAAHRLAFVLGIALSR